MQEALDQMNVQLHHVISDLTGLTYRWDPPKLSSFVAESQLPLN